MWNSECLGHEQIGKRIRVVKLPDGLETRINSPKNTFLLIFLPIWLVLWTAGGIVALWSLIGGRSGNEAFIAIWLCFWLLAELCAVYTVLWQILGQERITIRQGHLEMSKVIFRPLWVKSVLVAQIKDLRAAGQFDTVFSHSASLRYYGLAGGNVAFEAEGTTYRFGIGLDERDSTALAEVCRQGISGWF
jgi:hypothetical protein